MAAPSITELPEKTINTFLSKWNASSLPIQYTINNDKFPTGATVTNYFTQIQIFVNGSQVAEIKQIPDSDNKTKIDIRKYVQTALLFEISDSLKDSNASAEFYINGTEEYIDSGGTPQSNAITGGGSGVVHFASLSSLQFGNANGGNMYDYILDSSKLDLAKWMTFFERGSIVDTTSFLLSIIVNDPEFDLEIIQYDTNDNVILTTLTAIPNDGTGVYRLSISGVEFDANTTYMTVQALVTVYGMAISELFTIDVDLACADQPAAPTLLVGSIINDSDIKLDWTSNSNGEESGFGIERKLASEPVASFSQIDTVASQILTFTDTTGVLFTEYSYRVRALGSINSEYTNTIDIVAGDPHAAAFIKAIDDAGGSTTTTEKLAVNTLAIDLKAAGLFTAASIIYPMVGGTASSHKFNLVDPQDTDGAFRQTLSGGWTHSSTGQKPNGVDAVSNNHLKLQGFPAAAPNHSNNCIGLYSRTDQAAETADYGVSDVSRSELLWQRPRVSPQIECWYNGTFSAPFATGSQQADTRGFFLNNNGRGADGPVGGSFEVYRNKVNQPPIRTGTITADTYTLDMFLGCYNNNGSASTFSQREIAFFMVTEYLTTATERDDWYDIVQAFQTTLSRQV